MYNTQICLSLLLRIDFQWIEALYQTVHYGWLSLAVTRTAAPLILPSWSVIIYSTRASFQMPLGWFSLWTTTSLTSTGATSVPLLWWWASLRYSFRQRFQNGFQVRFRCLDLQFWLAVTLSSLSLLGTGSGKPMTQRPIRTWDGNSGSSRSFGETYLSGWELSTISTSVRAVRSLLYESLPYDLSKAPFCRSDQSFKDSSPPRSLGYVEHPFHTKSRKIFLYFLVAQDRLDSIENCLKYLSII